MAENVCGYDAETFDNGITPWDLPIDWPTAIMEPGRNKIVWNISWGPHFDDTKEFHYWITKADFNYEVGTPLTWDDFEEAPFCQLDYDHSQPNANPDVNALVESAQFETFCEVPERSGRHVIYGEWGRNHYTWERFHSCVDAVFDGNAPVITADIEVSPAGSLEGASTVSVDGSDSTGENLSYSWSILDQSTDATYSFDNTSAASTTLDFTNPSASGTVDVSLTVSSGNESTTTSTRLTHNAEGAESQWTLSKALVESATPLNSGDTVQLRIVDNNGVDSFVPSPAFIIDTSNAAADVWPSELALSINSLDEGVSVGVLNSNDDVTPESNATSNNIYTQVDADIASVFLNITSAPTPTPTPTPTPASGNCVYSIESEWNNGFTAKIKITNTGSSVINGWSVNWAYSDGSEVTHLWNANLSGDYTATNLSWNANIQPNQTVEFGFLGSKGEASATSPVVSGSLCD
ncbi:cellulose binding domain-containing protein [bacterium]|nr:cellulose binding domain-containing protein [bacterium]